MVRFLFVLVMVFALTVQAVGQSPFQFEAPTYKAPRAAVEAGEKVLVCVDCPTIRLAGWQTFSRAAGGGYDTGYWVCTKDRDGNAGMKKVYYPTIEAANAAAGEVQSYSTSAPAAAVPAPLVVTRSTVYLSGTGTAIAPAAATCTGPNCRIPATSLPTFPR